MHSQWLFKTSDAPLREILIAELSVLGFDSFDEDEQHLRAYPSLAEIGEEEVRGVAERYGVAFHREEIPEQNWNAIWEQQFEPVIVEGFCTVRADFHQLPVTTPYEVVITPKMSFGTGHHATTQLMITEMKDLDFTGRHVFDFGTGTGILAVLASLLGAASVLAVDNDVWSYENALENAGRNNSGNISIKKGSLELAQGDSYDIILANINRHILLHYMKPIHDLLRPGGTILMSGLLEGDFQVVDEAARAAGFVPVHQRQQEQWIVLRMQRAAV